jgi:hypothetical protein
VKPGSHTVLIKDSLATSTQLPITFTGNFEPNKYYTIFTYDTLTAAKYKMVETNITIPTADTVSRIRFANFAFSTTAMPNVDLFSVKRNANVFTNIAPTQVTDFIDHPGRITDTFYVRATGTTTNLTPVFTVTPTYKRSYTIVFRGRYNTTGTTGVARMLSLHTDY